MKRKQPKTTPEEFQIIWNMANSVAEVAEFFGRNVHSTQTTAGVYRNHKSMDMKFMPDENKGARQLFAETWNSSDSIEEAAQKLGKTKKGVQRTATRYRKQGIALKYFPYTPPNKHDEFQAAWNTSISLEEVASKLNMSPKSAGVYAAKQRKKGLALKDLRKQQVDFKAENASLRKRIRELEAQLSALTDQAKQTRDQR